MSAFTKSNQDEEEKMPKGKVTNQMTTEAERIRRIRVGEQGGTQEPTPVFVNSFRTEPWPCVYVSPTAAFSLQGQSCLTPTETAGPADPKTLVLHGKSVLTLKDVKKWPWIKNALLSLQEEKV